MKKLDTFIIFSESKHVKSLEEFKIMMLYIDEKDAEIIISALLGNLRDMDITKYSLESENKRLKSELENYKSQESEAVDNG